MGVGVGVGDRVTHRRHDLLIPQDLFKHDHSSWNKDILEIIEYSYIFIIANSSSLVFPPCSYWNILELFFFNRLVLKYWQTYTYTCKYKHFFSRLQHIEVIIRVNVNYVYLLEPKVEISFDFRFYLAQFCPLF